MSMNKIKEDRKKMKVLDKTTEAIFEKGEKYKSRICINNKNFFVNDLWTVDILGCKPFRKIILKVDIKNYDNLKKSFFEIKAGDTLFLDILYQASIYKICYISVLSGDFGEASGLIIKGDELNDFNKQTKRAA